MAKLLKEISLGSVDRRRRGTVDAFQTAVPSDDVKRSCVQLHCDEEGPLKQLGPRALSVRYQLDLPAAVGLCQVDDDRRTLSNGEFAILQQRNFLSRV